MKWKAKLIKSSYPTHPVYWSLTNNQSEIRLTIDVYKADKTTLDAAKTQVKELIKKLNS